MAGVAAFVAAVPVLHRSSAGISLRNARTRHVPVRARRARVCATIAKAVGEKSGTAPPVTARPMRSVPVPGHVLDCVVKIFATHCEPNYALPWAMTVQKQSVSTGFIISGNRILTNAHAVQHHTVVLLKRRGSDVKYRAKVVAVGNDCDIALLKVPDPRFWKEHHASIAFENGTKATTGNGVVVPDIAHPPFTPEATLDGNIDFPYLTAGGISALNDYCMVVGYPFPGECISVTTGVISRIEMQKYVHNNGDLLAVQIDAAINSGNSGGPVLNDAFQVVGIAFQSLDAAEAESVGYFIPNVVVEHFLDDIARNAAYTGFPCPGFSWQATENASLRASLSLPDDAGGVLVQRVDALGEAAGVLRKGDIVTHLDGCAVSRAGTVPFTLGERICFTYRVTGKFVGDRVRVRVLRDRAEKEVVYALPRMGEARLVPVHDSRRQPEYLIIGGLVFQSLSEPFLDSVYGASFLFDAPVHLIELYNHAQKKDDGVEEIVVLAQILSADVNEGYDDAGGVTVLSRCNGERVLSLRHLAEIIDKRGGKFLRFEHGQDEVIVLDRRAAEREAGDILDTHCIPHERSVGLMKKR